MKNVLFAAVLLMTAGSAKLASAEEFAPVNPGARVFVCSAQNGRGMVFTAEGYFPRETQERAMGRCRTVSRFCRPLGCR